MSAHEFLAAHQEAMLRDLRTFVERETPSTDLDRLADFAGFLAGYAETCGGNVTVIDRPEGYRHLRVEWGANGDRPVVLLGHFDTVWPVGTIDGMPFTVEGGRVHGPGAFDMKCGLVQGFWAMRALREEIASDRHVVLLCTADEEIGSPTSRAQIEEEASRAAAVLVLEPSHEGKLKTARKGVGHFHVDVQGRSSHAGLAPEAGISAIEELAHVILALHGLTDLGSGTTVNVGVVQGGTRSNVVAAEASAEVDVRFFSQAEAERVSDAVLGLKPHRAGIRLRVTGAVNRPPMERTAETAALYERAKDIAAGLGFPLGEVAVGGGSDGNFCSAMGVPVLDGLGAVGGGAHAPDEHIVVEAMPLRAALVAQLIVSL